MCCAYFKLCEFNLYVLLLLLPRWKFEKKSVDRAEKYCKERSKGDKPSWKWGDTCISRIYATSDG